MFEFGNYFNFLLNHIHVSSSEKRWKKSIFAQNSWGKRKICMSYISHLISAKITAFYNKITKMVHIHVFQVPWEVKALMTTWRRPRVKSSSAQGVLQNKNLQVSSRAKIPRQNTNPRANWQQGAIYCQGFEPYCHVLAVGTNVPRHHRPAYLRQTHPWRFTSAGCLALWVESLRSKTVHIWLGLGQHESEQDKGKWKRPW